MLALNSEAGLPAHKGQGCSGFARAQAGSPAGLKSEAVLEMRHTKKGRAEARPQFLGLVKPLGL